VHSTLRKQKSTFGKQDMTKIKLMNIGELQGMEFEKTDWLVDGLLPAVGTSIIGAAPKSGKSVFARQLCASVQLGWDFVGRQVTKGKTVYISTQDAPSIIKGHFLTMGCTTEDAPQIAHEPALNRENALEDLDETLTENSGVSLVVIDMLSDFIRVADHNDYREARQAYAGFADLAQKHRLHIAVLAHTKKVAVENPVHAIIGSTAIPGSFDQVICMSIDSRQRRYLQTAQRVGRSIPTTALNWDEERAVMSLGKTTDELKAENRRETDTRITADIVSYLTQAPESTRDDIFINVVGDQSAKYRSFKSLRENGLILQSGTGRSGDPYRFSLSTDLPREACASTSLTLNSTSLPQEKRTIN
jgi:hypothetical protein